MTYEAQVLLFLVRMKELVKEGRYTLVPRDKNISALAGLGWNEVNLIDVLCELSPENYSSGPEADYDRPAEDVWVFGTEIEETEYYLKLKIVGEPENVVCISFHEAEKPLRYPFKRRD